MRVFAFRCWFFHAEPMSETAGQRIKRLREERRWSQHDLADRLGVSSKTISNWERDQHIPRASLGALEKVFEQGLDDPTPLPEGVRQIGDPEDDLVEFTIEGNFGVKAVVKGPVRDMDAMQAAVSKLIAGMQTESNTRALP